MIVSNIIGGLGNQLFQFFAGYNLARTLDCTFKISKKDFENYTLHSFDLNKFNLPPHDIASTQEVKKLSRRNLFLKKRYIYHEPHFHFDENFFNITQPKLIKGYWQSEKYLRGIEEEIVSCIHPQKISTGARAQLEKIQNQNFPASIHIRRGDYISNAEAQKTHGSCSLDYYHRSVQKIIQEKPEAVFFIFSDDINWCKKHLKIQAPHHFIHPEEGKKNHEDLYLMSQCKANIIANSTFSWWAAWVSEKRFKNNLVIAPQEWFKDTSFNTLDLIPDRWERV